MLDGLGRKVRGMVIGDADNADACADNAADNTATTDQCNTAQEHWYSLEEDVV